MGTGLAVDPESAAPSLVAPELAAGQVAGQACKEAHAQPFQHWPAMARHLPGKASKA